MTFPGYENALGGRAHGEHGDSATVAAAECRRLVAYLERFVTARRLERFAEAIEHRTRYVTPVLENLNNTFNATAVTRTTDGLGLQDLHIVEDRCRFALSAGVTQGAAKWLTMHRYRGRPRPPAADSELPARARQSEGPQTGRVWGGEERDSFEESAVRRCYAALRAAGYVIAVTSPHAGSYTPESLPVDRPVAVVFGAEKEGISGPAAEEADYAIRIPVYGFVESFNVTVSAGITLYTLGERVRRLPPERWKLTEHEQLGVKLAWLQESVPRRVVTGDWRARALEQGTGSESRA